MCFCAYVWVNCLSCPLPLHPLPNKKHLYKSLKLRSHTYKEHGIALLNPAKLFEQHAQALLIDNLHIRKGG